MLEFSKWFIMREDYHKLRNFFVQNQGKWFQFRDDKGATQLGQLVDLLDEGTFLLKAKNGVSHDVHPSQIIGIYSA